MTPLDAIHAQLACSFCRNENGIDYHCLRCGRSWAAREGRG